LENTGSLKNSDLPDVGAFHCIFSKGIMFIKIAVDAMRKLSKY
jgi:hypothetical protein